MTIFSKIIAGEIPAYKVYEDEHVCAFLDRNPIHQGHTLVVPKKEVAYLFDLDDADYQELMERVKHVAQILKDKLNCKRVCAMVVGYEVPHAHVHLIPTNTIKEMDIHLAHQATDEELKEIHEIITQ